MPSLPTDVLQYAFGRCWVSDYLVARTRYGICALFFSADHQELRLELKKRFPNAFLQEDSTSLEFAIQNINAYAERLDTECNLELDVNGTPFQRMVWSEIKRIPAGETATYGEIAKRIGKASAYRAVANACGANPVSLIVPCHRVVRGDGDLTGYRWNVEIKKGLLKRESRLAGV